MSRWRSVNPAKYAPKSNALGDMLEGFASVYVPAVMKQKELDEKREYEEALERKRKNAAAAKAAAEQDKKDKKLAKDAKVLAQRYSGTTDNSEAVLYFTQQLQLFDGDVGDVISNADSMVEKGQLKFTSQQFEEEITRFDPTKAPPVRLDSIGSYTSTSVGQPEGESRPLTSLDLNRISSYKDDEDKSDTAKANAVVAEQMKANFGDQQLESSETETVTGTQYGVEITPAGQEFYDVDLSSISTVADINALERDIRVNQRRIKPEIITELGTMKAEFKAVEDMAWVTDASKSREAAVSKVVEFTARNDATNKKKAQAIVNSFDNQTKPYKELLEPSTLIGQTSAQLTEIKKTAELLGATEADLKLITTKITDAQAVENDDKARVYLEKATSANATIAQIELAKEEGAGLRTIKRLTDILELQQKTDIETQLAANGIEGAQAFDGVFTNPLTNEKGYGVLIKHPDGKVTLEDGTTEVVNSRKMVDMEAERYESIAVQTQKVSTELNSQGAALTEGLRNAETIISLAVNDPRVRNAGGDVAQGITNFARGTESVISVLDALFEGGKQVVTEEELKAALDKQGFKQDGIVDAFISGDIQALADGTARFEAAVLAFVFRAGRMEGQSGNAMSNKDFERLKEMLNVKGGVVAFETTVRNFMAEKIKSYDDKVVQFNTTGPTGTFVRDYGYSPVKAPQKYSDFVQNRKDQELSTAYQNTISYVPPDAPRTKDTSGDGTDTTNDFFNGATFTTKSGEDDVSFTLEDVENYLEELSQNYTGDELKSKQEEYITGLAELMNMKVQSFITMYNAATAK